MGSLLFQPLHLCSIQRLDPVRLNVLNHRTQIGNGIAHVQKRLPDALVKLAEPDSYVLLETPSSRRTPGPSAFYGSAAATTGPRRSPGRRLCVAMGIGSAYPAVAAAAVVVGHPGLDRLDLVGGAVGDDGSAALDPSYVASPAGAPVEGMPVGRVKRRRRGPDNLNHCRNGDHVGSAAARLEPTYVFPGFAICREVPWHGACGVVLVAAGLGVGTGLDWPAGVAYSSTGSVSRLTPKRVATCCWICPARASRSAPLAAP